MLDKLLTLVGLKKNPRTPVKRSPKWAGVRAAFLKDKVCAVCGGKEKLEAHHVEPFHVQPALELDPTNLIALCSKPGHECHFVFGHFWSWSKFNPKVRELAAWVNDCSKRFART